MHADRWAPWTAVVLALFLTGAGPVVDVASSLGLGPLLEPTVLLPLLALVLGVTLWSLATDRRYHREPVPSRLAWAGAVLIFAGHWLAGPAIWAGAALVAGAAVWNRREVGGLSRERARAREVDRRLG